MEGFPCLGAEFFKRVYFENSQPVSDLFYSVELVFISKNI